MSITNRFARAASGLFASMALIALVFALTAVSASAEHVDLEGVIHIEGGEPAGEGIEPEGSWVRIQEPGNPETAGFLVNPDSANVNDQTYTLLEPSESEEFELGEYQETDGDIVDPVEWDGFPFDIFTLPTDPSGGKSGTFPVPSLEYDTDEEDGIHHVTGDLSSWTVAWGGEEGFWYNQGANSVEPGDVHHPDGNLEGEYNENTGHIELRWSSVIVDNYPPPGGIFDGFVGYWHIEGLFEPA